MNARCGVVALKMTIGGRPPAAVVCVCSWRQTSIWLESLTAAVVSLGEREEGR
jgi:hypothetical protein